MNPVSRRSLLRSTALVPVVLTMAGCSALTQAVALAPQIATYIKAIASAAAVIAPFIEGVTNLGANVKSTISAALSDIQAVATDISGASSTTATGLVQKLGSGIGTLAGLLSGNTSVPDVVNGFISSALALVPTIEQAVGIVSAPAPVAASRFARMAATISPDEAYSNLLQIAAGH